MASQLIKKFSQFAVSTAQHKQILRQNNWKCVTFQFREIRCSTVLLKEKESEEKKWPYITEYVHPTPFGSRENIINTKDLPSYFSKGERPALPDCSFIEKDKIKEVIDGFKQSSKSHNYILPDGNVSRLAKAKKKAKFIVHKRTYISRSDAKVRVSVIQLKCKKPDIKCVKSETDFLIHHYTVEPKTKDIPDVKKGCIRTVMPVTDQKKSLENFAVTRPCYGFFIAKNDNKDYIQIHTRNNAVARIQVYEYHNLNDIDIKAINMTVTVFPTGKQLKKLKDLAFPDSLSEEAATCFC